MTRYESVLDAVGGTPLIRLNSTGLPARVYVKPEWYNPGASSKDRTALAMIRAAEADGSLRPGGTVVETTSGNTGIGLAWCAAALGYRSVLFTSSAISREKRDLLRAHGAQVRLVDAFVPKAHPDSLRSVAQRFVAQTPGAWLADQYDNPANPAAHYRTTGPEVWADTEGQVTHLVASVGTGGTITGAGRYLKDVSAGRVQVVGAEPFTSTYGGGDGSQKYIEGAGHFVHPEAEADVWPASFDPAVVDRYVRVPDRAAIDAIHRLAAAEGLLAGGSSGVVLVAALEVARDLGEDDIVVALLPDSGRAYLSTYFDEDWLLDRGFRDEPAGPQQRRVRDVIAAGTPAVDVTSHEHDAVRTLERAGVPGSALVLVLHERGREVRPHPSDVVGWTTLEDLRAAPTVAAAANGSHVLLGAGLTVSAALERAARTRPGWDVGLVLEDGRVAAAVRRAQVETPSET
jgi:cystathionine beta-synthase